MGFDVIFEQIKPTESVETLWVTTKIVVAAVAVLAAVSFGLLRR